MVLARVPSPEGSSEFAVILPERFCDRKVPAETLGRHEESAANQPVRVLQESPATYTSNPTSRAARPSIPSRQPKVFGSYRRRCSSHLISRLSWIARKIDQHDV